MMQEVENFILFLLTAYFVTWCHYFASESETFRKISFFLYGNQKNVCDKSTKF